MMDLVKNVGSKLDNKIKSGDIKESELMQEATELMSKMKDMPGILTYCICVLRGFSKGLNLHVTVLKKLIPFIGLYRQLIFPKTW